MVICFLILNSKILYSCHPTRLCHSDGCHPQWCYCTFKKNSAESLPSLISLSPPCQTATDKVCFLCSPSLRNRKIRQLFQKYIITVPSVLSYWGNQLNDIPWKKVWSLPYKYLINNKVKEVSFKLLQRFYPVNLYIKNVS